MGGLADIPPCAATESSSRRIPKESENGSKAVPDNHKSAQGSLRLRLPVVVPLYLALAHMSLRALYAPSTNAMALLSQFDETHELTSRAGHVVSQGLDKLAEALQPPANPSEPIGQNSRRRDKYDRSRPGGGSGGGGGGGGQGRGGGWTGGGGGGGRGTRGGGDSDRMCAAVNLL